MRTALNEIDDKKLRVNRKNFPCRKATYYKTIAPGISIGYSIIPGALPRWVLRAYGVGKNYIKPFIGICDDGVRKTSIGNINDFIRTANDIDDLKKMVAKETITYNQAVVIANHITNGPKAVAKTSKELTVEQAIANYSTHRKAIGASARSLKRDGYVLAAHGTRRLGHLTVKGITRAQLDSWMASLPGEHSNVNRIRASFVAVLNLAADTLDSESPELELMRRPWAKLPKRKEDQKTEFTQDKFLSVEQVKAWVACGENQEIRDFMTFGAMTGFRLGEIRELRVGDVQDSNVRVRQSKNGYRTSILSGAALKLLGRLGAGKKAGELYFEHPNGGIWKDESHHRYVERASAKAGLPSGYTFGLLRHIWITRALKEGVDVVTVAKLVGTSVKMIQQNYFELATEETTKSLNKFTTI